MAEKKTATAVSRTVHPGTIDYGIIALVVGVLAASVAVFLR